MIESIEGFAAAIAVRPEIVVRILKQPFDLDPGRALRGGTEDTAAAPARFVLRVSRPVNGTVPPESGGESRR